MICFMRALKWQYCVPNGLCMSHPPQALMFASNHPPEEGEEGKEQSGGRVQCLSINAQQRLACAFTVTQFPQIVFNIFGWSLNI